MSKTLIIYSTVDYHTKRISEFIAKYLDSEESIKIVNLEDINDYNLNHYDKILLGASIRYGKFRKELYEFIKSNRNLLDKKITCFFGVNLVARKVEKNSPDTNPYIIKFLEKSNWKPQIIDVFAGNLEYSKYKFFDKFIIKFIMWMTDGPTDTSKDYDFTDWDSVEVFAKKLNSIN